MGKYILTLIAFALSCSQKNCNWKGGEITNFGTFCNAEFMIKVYEKDNYLKYEVSNMNEEVIIRQDMNISVIHYWGLFLDSKKNLWVFSSDVGDCIWKKDTTTGVYQKTMFDHQLTRNEVPQELYESSLKRYIK